LQFAGAEQWSFVMNIKNHLKDLTQFFALVATAAQAVMAVIDLLGKVVNYGSSVRKLRLQVR
jgi:hypothetical protein